MKTERLVLERVLSVHELAPEVFFSSEGIVGRAAQGEIRRAVIAARGKRVQVVKLEAMGFVATRAVRVNVAATIAVALEDGAPDGGGNVTSAPARVPRLGILVEGIRVQHVLIERVLAFAGRSRGAR